MTNENRISPAQAKFLRQVRDASDTLAVIRSQHELSEKRFQRWLRNRFFSANFKRVLRHKERGREAVIVLAASAAAGMLDEAVRKKESLPVGLVLSLKVLNELAVQQSTVKRPQRSSGSKKKVKLDPERDLCHPDSKEKRAKLLEGLEG